MSDSRESVQLDGLEVPSAAPMDAVLYDGVDRQAERRTAMREATTARQAAERRFARPSPGNGGVSRAATTKERAEEFRQEMERIDAKQQRWQRDRGEVTADPPKRRRQERLNIAGPASGMPFSTEAAR